jgi:hypothetical protein
MRHPSLRAWGKSLVPALRNPKLIPSAILLALTFGLGCSDSPTTPGLPQETLENSSIIDFGQSGPQWTVVELMLRRGGSMNLDGDRLVCSFSPGALPIPQALIVAKMKLNGPHGSATRLDIDFQPSLVFKKQVTLKINSGYLAGNGNKYTLWYFDPVTHRWQKEMEQTYTGGLPVLFNLYHYSAYAITR